MESVVYGRPFAAALRACGFDTVLITGTVTNICCESSARDAAMPNFRPVMVSVLQRLWRCDGHVAALTRGQRKAAD